MEPTRINPNLDRKRSAQVTDKNFQNLSRRLNPIVQKDENGVARRIIGRLPDGTYGERVSKKGVDVTTAEDTDLVYKSDFSTDIYYDDDNARILIGALPDGSFGIAISKPGEDVTGAF